MVWSAFNIHYDSVPAAAAQEDPPLVTQETIENETVEQETTESEELISMPSKEETTENDLLKWIIVGLAALAAVCVVVILVLRIIQQRGNPLNQ